MFYVDIDTTKINNIQLGIMVEIRLDKTEIIKRGYIIKIISNSDQKKGIKVQINTGESGRIVGILSKSELEKEEFKFYNLFFNSNELYTINNKDGSVFVLESNGYRIAYLFSDKQIAQNLIKDTYLNDKKYHLNIIKRKKMITTLFSDYNVDIYIIDFEKQLTKNQLEEKEMKFKSF